jgi:Glycosyltransferase family 20
VARARFDVLVGRQVGWFLHTPFPSSEIYRTLPVREEVLRAVLKADLIGFHTYDYARHFVSACTRILGLEVRILPGAPACPFVCLSVCLSAHLGACQPIDPAHARLPACPFVCLSVCLSAHLGACQPIDPAHARSPACPFVCLSVCLSAHLGACQPIDPAHARLPACSTSIPCPRLGVQGTPEGVEDNGSLTRVAAFPIGIDPDRFQAALEKPEVRAHIAELQQRYAGTKVRLPPSGEGALL